MRRLLSSSVLFLSTTTALGMFGSGCAPKTASGPKSSNPLAVSNWKMPEFKKPQLKMPQVKMPQFMNSDRKLNLAGKFDPKLPWTKQKSVAAAPANANINSTASSNPLSKSNWTLPWSNGGSGSESTVATVSAVKPAAVRTTAATPTPAVAKSLPKISWPKWTTLSSVPKPQGESSKPLSADKWKLPWSKKSEAKTSWFDSSEELASRKDDTAMERFTRKAKESKLVQGVDAAWQKTTDKFASMKKKTPAPAATPNDPVSLATKSPPANAKTHRSMAELMETTGQVAQAEEHFKKALALEPTDLESLLGYGHLLDRQNRMAEAVAQYEAACKHHPQEARAFNDLGLCLARQQQLEKSVGALQQAIVLQPSRKLYRNNLATVFMELNRHHEAFAQLVAVHGVAVAHHNMGYLLNKKGDSKQAMFHFQAAARTDPNLVAAQRWADHLQAMHAQVPHSPALQTPAGGYQPPNHSPVATGYGTAPMTPHDHRMARPAGNPLR